MMKLNRKIINIFKALLTTFILGFITYYLLLPPINVHSWGFWMFCICSVSFFAGVLAILAYNTVESGQSKEDSGLRFVERFILIPLFAFVLILIAGIAGTSPFNAHKYANLYGDQNITLADFADYEGTVNNVPLLDKDSSLLIANRELGSLIETVSQFNISDSEQVTLKGKPVRVSALQYAGFFKWINNKDTGTPGYILVDMVTQDAELVNVESGLRYLPSSYFSHDLKRHLRWNYPTAIFLEPTLELDEEGHPFWLAPVIKHKIGLFGGQEVVGAISVDATTGEFSDYLVEEVPSWLDNVYPANLLVAQYDNYGSYQDGFWNSVFSQKGVRVTTEGYNYIPLEDDNWLYTGVTSVASDESNIGFIFANKRTKETRYYSIAGAEEYSAMSSAEGLIQHLGYISTFPLLLKIENTPTYLVALKDAGGLVKMYGMVNVEKYQIVATGETITSCRTKYRELLKDNGITAKAGSAETIRGTVTDIKVATKEGTTHYYIELDNLGKYYVLSVLDNEAVVLLNEGDLAKLELVEEGNTQLQQAVLAE